MKHNGSAILEQPQKISGKLPQNDFLNYMHNNWKLSFFTVIILLISYGIKLFHYSISIDTVQMLGDYNSSLLLNLTSGRFGYVLTKKILFMAPLDPSFSTALTLVVIFFYSITWCYLFYVMSGRNEEKAKWNWVFPAIFITAPIFAEQYNFTLQSFEVALGVLFCSLSLLCISKWITTKNKLSLIIGLVLMVWNFGTYQALAVLYIGGAIGCFLLLYDHDQSGDEKADKKLYISFILKHICAFLIGIVLYYLINKIILIALNAGSNYTDTFIAWKVYGSAFAIVQIKGYIKNILFGTGIFYNIVYSIVLLGFLVYSIHILFIRQKYFLLKLLAIFGILATPFILPVLLGMAGPIRTQLGLPFADAFGLYYLVGRIKPHFKKIKVLTAVMCLFLTFQQCQTTARLFYSDYIRYQQDVTLATQISDRIGQLNLGEVPPNPVAFVGYHTLNLNPSCILGEVMGQSFFTLNANAPWGNLPYACQFFTTLGYPYKSATLDEQKKAKSLSADMPSWPSQGSVQVKDEIVIVKLPND